MTIVCDLSHWNWDPAKPVNLKKFVDLGADGFIFKATQGTWYVDDRFKECVEQARGLNVPYSLYHFLDPIVDCDQDGNQQFDFFMDETEGYRSLSPNGLDVEWQEKLTNAQLGALVVDFLENYGEWLTYSNLNFLNNALKCVAPEIASYSDIWLAWPAPAAMKPIYPLYYAQAEVKLWQKSWNWYGVDMNVVLDEAWWTEKFVMPPVPKVYQVTLDIPKDAESIEITLNRRGGI